MRHLIPLAMATAMTLPSTALACGGFFCNNNAPVDQTAEEIAFVVDEDLQQVTAHVKIMYEGPAEEFSWIVPVKAEPTLSVGTDALFDQLSANLVPWYQRQVDFGECPVTMTASATTVDSGGYSSSGGTVQVVSKGTVGPYDTVVLTASDTQTLVDWLNEHNFDVPAGTDAVLQPYLASGAYFVALRLAKDKDTGDLAPLVMTYEGTRASIPIQLTAIAAQPDMRLRVYVFGNYRAVPESYLHVRINPFAVNYWTNGSNYEDVISLAADEAGGHAFATDYSGPADFMAGTISRSDWTAERLAASQDQLELFTTLVDFGYPLDDAMLGVLSDLVTLPPELDGWAMEEVLSCVSCVDGALEGAPVDAAFVASVIDEEVLQPRAEADALFTDYPIVSRMTSSVSPEEMTIDPVFVFNSEMGPVERIRQATEIYDCSAQDGEGTWESPRRLRIDGYPDVQLPSMEELNELEMSEFEWLEMAGWTTPASLIIEATAAEGMPEVLVDRDPDAMSGGVPPIYDDAPEDSVAAAGCGCDTTGPASVGWLALLAGLFVRRRR